MCVCVGVCKTWSEEGKEKTHLADYRLRDQRLAKHKSLARPLQTLFRDCAHPSDHAATHGPALVTAESLLAADDHCSAIDKTTYLKLDIITMKPLSSLPSKWFTGTLTLSN